MFPEGLHSSDSPRPTTVPDRGGLWQNWTFRTGPTPIRQSAFPSYLPFPCPSLPRSHKQNSRLNKKDEHKTPHIKTKLTAPRSGAPRHHPFDGEALWNRNRTVVSWLLRWIRDQVRHFLLSCRLRSSHCSKSLQYEDRPRRLRTRRTPIYESPPLASISKHEQLHHNHICLLITFTFDSRLRG